MSTPLVLSGEVCAVAASGGGRLRFLASGRVRGRSIGVATPMRPAYDLSVREVLRGLEVGLDDCALINGDNFARVVMEAAWPGCGPAHQPVAACAQLLALLHGFVAPARPSAHALWLLLGAWRRALLGGGAPLDALLARELAGLRLAGPLAARLARFRAHVARAGALIGAVLDFRPPRAAAALAPVRVPVWNL